MKRDGAEGLFTRADYQEVPVQPGLGPVIEQASHPGGTVPAQQHLASIGIAQQRADPSLVEHQINRLETFDRLIRQETCMIGIADPQIAASDAPNLARSIQTPSIATYPLRALSMSISGRTGVTS